MKDLVPVSLTARFALMLVVGASVPAKSVPELVAMGKASDIAYASQGTGSPHHLAMEMLRQRAPLRLTHVPYRGSAPAVNDLLSGLVPTMFLDLGTASQHIRSGKIRVLAVSSPKRLKDWPDVPTLAESGFPGYEAWAWQGLSVLAATPKAVVERLQAAYLKAAADPTNRQRIIDKGGEILTSTPDEMRAYMQAETVKWSRLVREAKTKVD